MAPHAIEVVDPPLRGDISISMFKLKPKEHRNVSGDRVTAAKRAKWKTTAIRSDSKILDFLNQSSTGKHTVVLPARSILKNKLLLDGLADESDNKIFA